MVSFCPRCGTMMRPQRKSGKVVLVCPKCGYVMEASDKDRGRYKLRKRIEHTEKEKIIVIDESKIPKVLPTTKGVVCPKCGNNEAYYWVVQTRRADEPPTRFFRCTKCGYVWREYA